MIIAVDFDGTLCDHCYPGIGKPREKLIEKLKLRQSEYNDKIILWTCRSGKYLADAVKWCENHGLILHAVNEDIKSIKLSQFGKEKSCKIYADVYIDDRNLPLIDIMRTMKDIKPEYAKLINDHFWDLI